MPTTTVRKYPLTSPVPLTREEIYERLEVRINGYRALAVLNEAFRTGILTIPNGFKPGLLLQAWMQHSIRNGHPEVTVTGGRTRSSIHLSMPECWRDRTESLRLTDEGIAILSKMVIAASIGQTPFQVHCNGLRVRVKAEDAPLLARQILDVALEHHELYNGRP